MIQKQLLKTIILAGLIVVFLVGGLCVYLSLSFQAFRVPEGLSSYDFIVSEGQTMSDVLVQLENRGFISDANLARWYIRFSPERENVVHAGEYNLVENMKFSEILATLQGGSFEERLTFIEGWRIEEYVAYLSQKLGNGFAWDFYTIARDKEGMLFPDTYFVDNTTTPQGLFDSMFQNFEQKFSEISSERIKHGLTKIEIVILASIVERETIRVEDKRIVAGIFLKRLQNDWILGSDVTVQYAMSTAELGDLVNENVLFNSDFIWWPATITEGDLQIPSLFNTRLFAGLPPHPISNPGINSLEAVINPVESDYWYFLADGEGIIRYARTLEEHNYNIAKYGVL